MNIYEGRDQKSGDYKRVSQHRYQSSGNPSRLPNYENSKLKREEKESLEVSTTSVILYRLAWVQGPKRGHMSNLADQPTDHDRKFHFWHPNCSNCAG
jgi:hypothetical protein